MTIAKFCLLGGSLNTFGLTTQVRRRTELAEGIQETTEGYTMHPLEKKEMRKFRNKVRRLEAKGIQVGIEGVIRHSAASPIKISDRAIDADKLYKAARTDMDMRIKLTNMWHAGNVQAGKRRRKLNDWELATDPAGPVDAWQEDSQGRPKTGGKRAVGKCDVDAVTSLNKQKRGY